MADMNFFTDFKKLWGSTGTIEPVTQDQYQLGWAYIGALPPAVEQFNKVQQLSDEKIKWLYTQIETYAAAHSIPLTAATVDALGLVLTHALSAGVTPPQFDNDTSYATTAFVQRALGNRSGMILPTLPFTILPQHLGHQITITSGTPGNITLPLLSATTGGVSLRIWNYTAGVATVVCAGTDGILHANAAPVSSYPIQPGMTLELVSAGGGYWHAVGGTSAQATAPQFNNAKNLATTEFVKRQGLQASGIYYFATNTTLTAAHAGSAIYNYGSGVNITLPLISTLAEGVEIKFWNVGTSFYLIGQGTDQIRLPASTGAANFLVGAGDTITVTVANGTWWITNGSVTLPGSALFAASKAASGYQKLPSGLIIQWGSIITSDAGFVTVTFPIAFPSQSYQEWLTPYISNQEMVTTAVKHTGAAASVEIATSIAAGYHGVLTGWLAIGI
jgi:hypothetical protein